MEEPVSQDSILCSSCWFGLHRLLHWLSKSTLLCCVQIGCLNGKHKDSLHCWNNHGERRTLFVFFNSHRYSINSCRKIAAYEQKISQSYSTSSHHTLYITIALFLVIVPAVHLYGREVVKMMAPPFLLAAAIPCVVVTAFSYFKVFRIVRHHQCQVQANENAEHGKIYKKSIFRILKILASLLHFTRSRKIVPCGLQCLRCRCVFFVFCGSLASLLED